MDNGVLTPLMEIVKLQSTTKTLPFVIRSTDA